MSNAAATTEQNVDGLTIIFPVVVEDMDESYDRTMLLLERELNRNHCGENEWGEAQWLFSVDADFDLERWVCIISSFDGERSDVPSETVEFAIARCAERVAAVG